MTWAGEQPDPLEAAQVLREPLRVRLWQAAGVLLIGLGVLLVVIGIGGLLASAGGLAYVALAVPPAGLGILVVRRVGRARVSALSVSLAYAAFVASVATAPYRGLTEADPASLPSPDAGLVLVGGAFVAAAILLLIGDPGERVGSAD